MMNFLGSLTALCDNDRANMVPAYYLLAALLACAVVVVTTSQESRSENKAMHDGFEFCFYPFNQP